MSDEPPLIDYEPPPPDRPVIIRGEVIGRLTSSYTDTYKTGLHSNPRRRLKRRLNEAIGEAPKGAMGVLLLLIADCDLRAYDAARVSKRWGSAYYFLGLPAAVLATIAGATGLASTAGRIPAAIVALVSAGLTAAATFLNSNENKQQSNRLSAAWQELADDVRLAILRHSESKPELRDTSTEDQLITEVIGFNKRKGALLRRELPPATALAVSG
ncbi:MAG: hypothetical protein JWL58_7293 [Streptosporangiaceae bacterium]|jgi:hypothetical protein|nr:hypothetical protein [Streptosporangiaceae bacterium]